MSEEAVRAEDLGIRIRFELAHVRFHRLFRNRFRELQRLQGFTLEDLGKRMGLKPADVSKLLAKPKRNMTLRQAEGLMHAMGQYLELTTS